MQSLSPTIFHCGMMSFKNHCHPGRGEKKRKTTGFWGFLFFLFTWDVASSSTSADNISPFWQCNNIFLSVITSRDA